MFNIKIHGHVLPRLLVLECLFLKYYKTGEQKTKYLIQNTWIMKFQLEACTLLYMLLPIYMYMYYICTNIPLIPPLPLSVRLKHPSLSPDRESAPHCRTIALGWYISITLVITYRVIHSTYDSYEKLQNFLKLHCIGIDFNEDNLCI